MKSMQGAELGCCCGRGFSPDASSGKLSGLKPLPQYLLWLHL